MFVSASRAFFLPLVRWCVKEMRIKALTHGCNFSDIQNVCEETGGVAVNQFTQLSLHRSNVEKFAACRGMSPTSEDFVSIHSQHLRSVHSLESRNPGIWKNKSENSENEHLFCPSCRQGID